MGTAQLPPAGLHPVGTDELPKPPETAIPCSSRLPSEMTDAPPSRDCSSDGEPSSSAIASSTWLIVVVSAILLLLVTTSLVMVSVTRASLRR